VKVYTRSIGSAFVIGQGNWGGPKGPRSVNFPPPKDKKADAVDEVQIGPEAALLYRLAVTHLKWTDSFREDS